MHNFRVLAWMLLNGIFNLPGSCNFKWLRVAETAHPTTIARLIGRSVFGGHDVYQSISCEEKYPRHIQANWFASSRQLLSLRYGGVDVTRCIRVPACQMILAVLDHALHADNTWADRVDLATRHRCPLDRLPASLLLLPRSGLERSDFVLWHLWDMPTASSHVRFRG
jgi:hypothetical protein